MSDSSSLSRSSSSNSNRQAITDDVRVQSGQQLLDKVYEEASRSIFEKKVFIIGDKEHKLTAIFNFFTSPTKFATKPTKTISHKCIICGKSLEEEFGFSSNLNHHLRRHSKKNIALKNWYEAYEKMKALNNENQNNLDKHTMDLVNFFLTCNLSLECLSNKYLRNLLKVKLPCSKTFTTTILPRVMKILIDLLTPKLKNAVCITLISDIWTNLSQVDFLGLIAVCTDRFFNKEYLVIGMETLNAEHKSENVAEAINKIVNNYEFDKSKINATVSDEGSNFVKLFKYQDSDLTFNFNQTDEALKETLETEETMDSILTLCEIDKLFDDETPEEIILDNPINILITTKNVSTEKVDTDDDDQYTDDLEQKYLLDFIDIKVGSLNVPSYSCADIN